MMPDRAYQLARGLLEQTLPRRWRHVQGVARAATGIARLTGNDADLVIAAAWLHDIGYAPTVVRTGFHPLDGAEYLLGRGADIRLCGLVGYHTAAVVEAGLRGLKIPVRLPRELSSASDALWWCDLVTGPDGHRVSVPQRLGEIRSRYGPGHVVTAFVDAAEHELLAAAERTERRLRAIGA